MGSRFGPSFGLLKEGRRQIPHPHGHPQLDLTVLRVRDRFEEVIEVRFTVTANSDDLVGTFLLLDDVPSVLGHLGNVSSLRDSRIPRSFRALVNPGFQKGFFQRETKLTVGSDPRTTPHYSFPDEAYFVNCQLAKKATHSQPPTTTVTLRDVSVPASFLLRNRALSSGILRSPVAGAVRQSGAKALWSRIRPLEK